MYVSRVLCIIVYIAEPEQCFECDFKRIKEGTEEINLFLEQTKIFSSFLFILTHVLYHAKSVYIDTCTLSCKIVVASNRPLIKSVRRLSYWVFSVLVT